MTIDGPGGHGGAESEEDFPFVCLECGVPIRLSRVKASDVGELSFYADERGYENIDFHFHVPA